MNSRVRFRRLRHWLRCGGGGPISSNATEQAHCRPVTQAYIRVIPSSMLVHIFWRGPLKRSNSLNKHILVECISCQAKKGDILLYPGTFATPATTAHFLFMTCGWCTFHPFGDPLGHDPCCCCCCCCCRRRPSPPVSGNVAAERLCRLCILMCDWPWWRSGRQPDSVWSQQGDTCVLPAEQLRD